MLDTDRGPADLLTYLLHTYVHGWKDHNPKYQIV